MSPRGINQARRQLSGELELISVIRRRASALKSPHLRLGIGDDCALLSLKPGEELAVTTDLSVDSRHFSLGIHPPESVGHRTLARGLSDLAAMGARPVAAFLSLGLPLELVRPADAEAKEQKSWADRFLAGLFALASRHKAPLAGGDLCQSPHAVADIVLLGAVPRGTALLRSGARPGDLLYVTGKLGGAAAGLDLLSELAGPTPDSLHAAAKPLKSRLAPHLYPKPRLEQGTWLRSRKLATAAIDLSDGLSSDLHHLCESSGVAAEIESTLLPIAPGATLEQALHGGEDYELLFTVPPATSLPRVFGGVTLTRIGCILPVGKNKPTVTLLTYDDAEPLLPRGWQHFV